VVHADVVVVGAGPGGCAAAVTAAAAGLRVVILEGRRFPRHRPGETLHPGVEPILRRLGVADAFLAADFLRHEGHWVEWGGPRQFVPFGHDAGGPWRGFQAWRSQFDALLLEGARRRGALVRQPCPGVSACLEGGRVRGVETGPATLRARFVVDGTGRRQWLARQLRLPATRPPARLVAWYGYASGRCPARDDAPLLAADDGGWTWTARVRPHLYQWTRLPFTPARLAPGWLPQEFAGLRAGPRTRAADVSWRAVESPAGPGYFLVGDAAGVLDPSSSHGVLRALLSGLVVGRLLADVLCGSLRESDAAAYYRSWLGDWFARDRSALADFYSRLRCPPPGALVPPGRTRDLGTRPDGRTPFPTS
jgi:flavin-dependent dehydrogenase